MQVRNLSHPLLPAATPEERSRQRAVVTLRRVLNQHVRSRNLDAYAREGEPAFVAREGHAPANDDEVAAAFALSPSWRIWSAMNRAAQEMLWLAVGEPVCRDVERIEAEAAARAGSPARLGELHLDPAFTPPDEIAGTDIHLQPGGYLLDRSGRDVLAGALYENGGNVYSFGQGIGRSDSKAGAIIEYLARQWPAFRPARVLEIGCSAGSAASAYAAHWRDADVHAVDLGAGMLRYAHARAEALGVRVVFHQMDGAALSFADESFDLVVSNNLLHEIGRDQRRRMMAEARRVARRGGLVVHQDVPTRYAASAAARIEKNWDERFNGEIFWSIYTGDDLAADMHAAGFPSESVREERIDKLHGPGGWYVLAAARTE
jgi:SAM-dependent methyltransferase